MLSGIAITCSAVDLVRVNSRMPSSPWIRPNPESPMPPNGNDGIPANPITELIDVMPARSLPASARAALPANTVEPSPYFESFASRTASSSEPTRSIGITGPNVSSLITFMR